MIYAIQCGADGPIKLGRAKVPQRRLKNLQVSHFDKLTLLGVSEVADDSEVEKSLHAICKKYRIRGEWFSPSELVMLIAQAIKINYAQKVISHVEAYTTCKRYRAHMRRYDLLSMIAIIKRWEQQYGTQKEHSN